MRSEKFICLNYNSLTSRCVENCHARSNPSGRISLQGICSGPSCHGNLIYKWTVFKNTKNYSNDTQWIEVMEIQKIISTRVSSKSLVTKPGVLKSDTQYKFILTAPRKGRYSGYSEFKVTLNSPPVGGVCNVSPLSGITLTTEFTFKCLNWQDPDRQLQYQFSYLTDNNLLNVVYKGVKTSLTTKLPAGEKKHNFTIDFRVRVADILGTFIEVRTPVQVTKETLKKHSCIVVA